ERAGYFLSGRSLTGRGRLGRGFQPAIVRAHSRARAVSVMAGNSRRTSTAAANSPRCSKGARIASASASLITNITGAWGYSVGGQASGLRFVAFSQRDEGPSVLLMPSGGHHRRPLAALLRDYSPPRPPKRVQLERELRQISVWRD